MTATTKRSGEMLGWRCDSVVETGVVAHTCDPSTGEEGHRQTTKAFWPAS